MVLGNDLGAGLRGEWLATAEDFPEPRHREQPSAQAQQFLVMAAFDDHTPRAGFKKNDFLDVTLRQSVSLPAALEEETGNDCERQRQTEREGRAFACSGVNLENAAYLFEVGFHHVHADSPAGQIGDSRGSGESR